MPLSQNAKFFVQRFSVQLIRFRRVWLVPYWFAMERFSQKIKGSRYFQYRCFQVFSYEVRNFTGFLCLLFLLFFSEFDSGCRGPDGSDHDGQQRPGVPLGCPHRQWSREARCLNIAMWLMICDHMLPSHHVVIVGFNFSWSHSYVKCSWIIHSQLTYYCNVVFNSSDTNSNKFYSLILKHHHKIPFLYNFKNKYHHRDGDSIKPNKRWTQKWSQTWLSKLSLA